MMLLNVFSKPLHIPEAFRWVLMVGVFIPLGFMFYLIKKQKQEKYAQPAATDATAQPASAARQTVRKRLILMMLLGSVIGLCSPLWLPLTGTTLGPRGDFICGIITVAIVCSIFGFRLRKL
jgi:hypothetical protein